MRVAAGGARQYPMLIESLTKASGHAMQREEGLDVSQLALTSLLDPRAWTGSCVCWIRRQRHQQPVTAIT